MRWVLLVALAVATTARATILDTIQSVTLKGPQRALALSVAKSLPVPAASSGITFTFDPRTSAFERDTEILGQVYLERAHPIGKGRLNMNVIYQYVETDLFDGHDMHFSDLRPIRDSTGVLFVIPRFNVDLVTHVVTTSATYGVTDDLDVNLTVPVLQTSIDVSTYLLKLDGGSFSRQNASKRESATATGIGDIFLRGKYRLLRGSLGELAAALVFRLPSGNEDDLEGTGLFEVSPYLYASTPQYALSPQVHVQAHLNAGLELTPQNTDRSEARFGLGIDLMLASWATLSVAFIGREPFAQLVEPKFLNVTRADGSRTPIFGLDSGRPSYYDFSFGGRVNLWRDTVFGIVDVVVPINQDGVRASVVPLVGIEVAF